MITILAMVCWANVAVVPVRSENQSQEEHSEITIFLWIHLWAILLDLPGITMLSLLNVILSRNLVETSNKNCMAGNTGYVEGKSHQPLAYLLTTGIHYCKMDYPYYWYHIGVTVMENYMGFLFVFFTIFSQCITDSINKKLLLFEMEWPRKYINWCQCVCYTAEDPSGLPL